MTLRYPIGFKEVRAMIFYDNPIKMKREIFVRNQLKYFVGKVRTYSKFQRKFFQSKLKKSSWIDMDLLKPPFKLNYEIESTDFQNLLREKPLPERSSTIDSKEIQGDIESQIDASISDSDVRMICGLLNKVDVRKLV